MKQKNTGSLKTFKEFMIISSNKNLSESFNVKKISKLDLEDWQKDAFTQIVIDNPDIKKKIEWKTVKDMDWDALEEYLNSLQ